MNRGLCTSLMFQTVARGIFGFHLLVCQVRPPWQNRPTGRVINNNGTAPLNISVRLCLLATMVDVDIDVLDSRVLSGPYLGSRVLPPHPSR